LKRTGEDGRGRERTEEDWRGGERRFFTFFCGGGGAIGDILLSLWTVNG
jgi:hypothetical protein